MNINTVKTEKGNVSCETPEGTVVHININQRSAFDCLLDTFRVLRDMRKGGEKPNTSTPGSAAHLGYGVAFISLGLVSVMLAIIICVVKLDIGLFYSQVHFWVGFPFIVSGILNLVAYKFPKPFWMAIAFIAILVNFGVSIAGMVVAINDVQRLGWIRHENVCDDLLKRSNDYYRTTAPPRYYYRNEDDYNLSSCKSAFQMLKLLQGGLIIMTLLMMIWGLCLAILRVGCKVKSWCSSCQCQLERAEDKDELIKSDPAAGDIIIA